MSRLLDVSCPDVTLRCQVHGQGPVVLCLHGFPDCERTFREQVGSLTAAGFLVVLPTMRGYAPSSPSRQGRYDAQALADDVLAVAAAVSPVEPVRVFGHDWGAIAAYAAAARAPERFCHLVTAAVPPLAVAGLRFLRPAQLRRSWYIGLAQLRGPAERRLLAGDMALVDRLWRDWSPGYLCPPEEMSAIKDALRPHPSAVLGYYRALRPSGLALRGARSLLAPLHPRAMYLHGHDDGCVGVELTEGVERAYRGPVQVHRLAGAGHFLHLERPDEVNRLLLTFLQSS